MVVEIPIEVRFKESKEIDNKIKKIEETDRKFKTLPKSNKKDSVSNQAVPTLDTKSFADPTQFLKKAGKKDPLGIRNNRDANGVVTRKELQKVLTDRLGDGNKLLDLLQGKGGGGSQLAGFATKLAPPIAAALIAIGFVKKVIDIAFGPGGPFDIRFKEFEERSKKLFSERDQQLKKQGIKTVRITSYYGSRGGRDTTFSTLNPLRKGVYAFDRDLNLLSKGLIK